MSTPIVLVSLEYAHTFGVLRLLYVCIKCISSKIQCLLQPTGLLYIVLQNVSTLWSLQFDSTLHGIELHLKPYVFLLI